MDKNRSRMLKQVAKLKTATAILESQLHNPKEMETEADTEGLNIAKSLESLAVLWHRLEELSEFAEVWYKDIKKKFGGDK